MAGKYVEAKTMYTTSIDKDEATIYRIVFEVLGSKIIVVKLINAIKLIKKNPPNTIEIKKLFKSSIPSSVY